MSKKGRGRGAVAQLLDFSGSRRPLVYVGCALSAVSMLLSFVPYVCIWLIVRDLLAHAPQWSRANGLETYGFIAMGTAAASLALYFVALVCTHLAAFRAASAMRKRTLTQLMRVPLGFFDSNASGALRRVIDGCAAQAEDLIAHKLADTTGSAAMLIGMIALSLLFDWRLGAACLTAAMISVLCIMWMFARCGEEFMRRYHDMLDKMGEASTEYVRGIPVVKVFQQTIYSCRALHDAIEDYARLAREYAVKLCRPAQTLQLTVINGMIIFLIPAAILLAPGAGDAVTFIANVAFYAIFSAVLPTAMVRIFFVSESAQTAADALARVKGLLAADPLPSPDAPRTPQGNDIVFDRVSLTYEGAEEPALLEVSFRVPDGATVALVGPSGGGKTTAASLVPRFWDADGGSVRIGGVDVRDMDPHDLMDRVAFVFQTTRLVRDTLLANVRAARPAATREEALAALEAAQCADIVSKLPRGVDTMLGAGGVHLSGGEVQRVALARAILKDAPIIVLDEATAFADPESEALIQRALSRLARGRTVLMIAHRLSTVAGADRIVVLDRGRVVEQGDRAALEAAGGLYARMWTAYERAAAWKISGVAGSSRPVADIVEGSVA